MKEKENINDNNSQNVKIYRQENHNDNKNEISTDAYPAFKNRLKALFSEFANEEGQNLQPSAPAINFSEKILKLPNACCRFLMFLCIIIVCIILIIVFGVVGKTCYFIIPVPALGIIVSIILMCNFITISPGEALVLTYYGEYIGTCKDSGFFWVRPCSDKRLISLKSNHFNGNMIKVNDKDGTPILIGLVCVWRIRDTVKATYCVIDIASFMKGQTESAIRYIANNFHMIHQKKTSQL